MQQQVSINKWEQTVLTVALIILQCSKPNRRGITLKQKSQCG